MKRFLQLFKKVDGVKVLKQYKKAGVLFFALTEVLRLGFSKKALEIIRLSVQYKIQKKLKKEYSHVSAEFDKEYAYELQHEPSNYLWICWLQGIDKSPLLVQRCYESVSKYLSDRKIVIITADNFSDYVELPDYILDKWHKGIISNTHFSDLLRLELLIKHGGLWLDATVLCTGGNIPECQLNSDLFLYQILKPSLDGHCINISSWFIEAKTNNKILMLTREFLYEYWKRNNMMIDYYLLHSFFNIACEYYPEEWNKVSKMSNSIPHILLLELFEKYNEEEYKRVCKMTCFHKLSYKFNDDLKNRKGTYYDKIVNKEF